MRPTRCLRSVLALALVALFVVPASAFGITVHVRVEGATTTIFGATQPLVTPFVGSLDVGGESRLDLSAPTALGALEGASLRGEFYFRVLETSFGPYVAQVGRLAGEGSSGWAFKVNGVSPPVGADATTVKQGDEVLWYWATFGETGGPPTLDLRRVGRCFRAVALDDQGAATVAKPVVFRLDGRSIRSRSGTICPTGRWSTLRAEQAGAVRSEVVTRR